MTLIAVEARVGLVSGVRRATHPGKTGLLAIETITGEVLAWTHVERLLHDIVTIKPLDKGPTGGDACP
jgi:hypothetical protein